jgi:hypothetical protein
MADNDKQNDGNAGGDDKKPKKNPPPVAKPLKKKRKKGPAAAVKIPQGLPPNIMFIPPNPNLNLSTSLPNVQV